MSLREDFEQMIALRRDALDRYVARIEETTNSIERLMQQNEFDQARRAELVNDIEYLAHEIAQLEEHAPLPSAPPAVPPSDPPPVPQAQTDTQAEVDAMRKARQDAAQQQAQGRRRQRSKPDPVKAARKAARTSEEERVRGGGFSRDPLKVIARTTDVREGRGAGATRARVVDGGGHPAENPTPTDIARADLVCEYLEVEGARSQHQIALFLVEYLDCKESTAKSITSKALALLQHQRRILWTGQKVPVKAGGAVQSAVWKIRETPPEEASGGVPEDDEAAPTTTRWPNAATTPGFRPGFVTEEPSNFERGKKS